MLVVDDEVDGAEVVALKLIRRGKNRNEGAAERTKKQL